MHYREPSRATRLSTLIGLRGGLARACLLFDWQALYRLAEPIDVPAGTRVICEGWFDNTIQNRFNPQSGRYGHIRGTIMGGDVHRLHHLRRAVRPLHCSMVP